jgi:hypothetical protein
MSYRKLALRGDNGFADGLNSKRVRKQFKQFWKSSTQAAVYEEEGMKDPSNA